MNKEKYGSIFWLLIIAPILTIINILIIKYLVPSEIYNSFHYPIPIVYFFFTIASVIILLLQIKIKEKNPDQVGYVFLLATSVKTGLSYVLLYPLLNQQLKDGSFEKINFFIIFILFLAIEVFFTSKILNNLNQNDSNS